MSAFELMINMLVGAITTELSKNIEPQNYDKNREVAIRDGSIVRNARKEIESTIGKPVLTEKNAVDFIVVIEGVIMIKIIKCKIGNIEKNY